MVKRKDSRGRALETGETQRKDGKYSYRYTDSIGKRHEIYASNLAKLREKEKKIKIMLWQDVDVGRGNTTTLNDVFDRYMETKFGLKKTTFANYLKMYDRYVRDEFGKRFLWNIRYFLSFCRNIRIGADITRYFRSCLVRDFVPANLPDCGGKT